jgi:alpha-beta hydrolase superfamily lysophospholipase
MIYKLLLIAVGVLIVAIIPVAVITFDAPVSPPPMASMAESLKRIDAHEFPPPRQFRARDGASLQYYAYPAAPDKVAVLIHGTAGPGTSMHALAEALRAAGVTAYVLDIRGHGGSGRRGDIDYIGQIDDDLVDFVAQLGPEKSGETRTLVGFSGGAGLALRFAGGPSGSLFGRYVLLAPILPGSGAWRPSAGGWVNIALPRLITIAYLGRAGIHWFDGWPVISYAVSADPSRDTTASYSYRLSTNFGAGRLYESYLKNLHRPAAILVGDADEQVVADQFAPLLRGLGVDIPVTIVPGMKHADMIARPEALQMVVRAVALQE